MQFSYIIIAYRCKINEISDLNINWNDIEYNGGALYTINTLKCNGLKICSLIENTFIKIKLDSGSNVNILPDKI